MTALDSPRTAPLSLGAMCRLGFLCSTCFWIPAGILLGIAVLFGSAEVDWLGETRSGMVGALAAFATAVVMALVFDAIFAIGAAMLVLLRRLGWRVV